MKLILSVQVDMVQLPSLSSQATLPEGRKVAIKGHYSNVGQTEREFQAKAEALSRTQHQNIVSLQGYCRFENDQLLNFSIWTT